MKRILTLAATLTLCAGSLLASNSAKHFEPEKKDGYVGGVVGNSIIYIYRNAEAAKISDKMQLMMLKDIAKKQICEQKDTRSVIEDSKLSVVFIYEDIKTGKTTIVYLDSCKED